MQQIDGIGSGCLTWSELRRGGSPPSFAAELCVLSTGITPARFSETTMRKRKSSPS